MIQKYVFPTAKAVWGQPLRDKFKKITGLSMSTYIDGLMLAMTGGDMAIAFDLIRFEDYCRKFLDYEKYGDESLEEFVFRTWGEPGKELFYSILNIRFINKIKHQQVAEKDSDNGGSQANP